MRPVDRAVFVADLGIEGCRHARPKSRRQVLLIEEEVLEEFGLRAAAVKENVTTRGIDLQSLPVDTRLRLGAEVVLWITGPCHPCAFMDEIRPGLQEEIRGRRGVLAWVNTGGSVRLGDKIETLPVRNQSGEGRE
jgi:MOSC domain-containing protein YiiM